MNNDQTQKRPGLPIRWAVKHDGSQLFNRTVVKYLNKVSGLEIDHLGFAMYYGQDHPTDVHRFKVTNNPLDFHPETQILRIDQFVNCLMEAGFQFEDVVDPISSFETEGQKEQLSQIKINNRKMKDLLLNLTSGEIFYLRLTLKLAHQLQGAIRRLSSLTEAQVCKLFNIEVADYPAFVIGAIGYNLDQMATINTLHNLSSLTDIESHTPCSSRSKLFIDGST